MKALETIQSRLTNSYRQWSFRLSGYHKWNRKLKKTWSALNFPPEDLQWLLALYYKYREDLWAVKREQQELFNRRGECGLVPQLCDLEAELTYLRIREYKPATVVEISPASGWSTTWILQALKHNAKGKLHSFDLVDDSVRVVPPHLSQDRWFFYQGDIKQNIGLLPKEADYLFIDSDHSGEFGEWYINNIFPLYKKGTKVSVHDIMKWAHEPGWGEESYVLCNWLLQNNMNCVTACRILRDKGYDSVMRTRSKAGINSLIQEANFNSMLFFSL